VATEHRILIVITGEHSIGVLAAGSRSLHKAALSHLLGERQA